MAPGTNQVDLRHLSLKESDTVATGFRRAIRTLLSATPRLIVLFVLLPIIAAFIAIACSNYSPKEYGLFRIEQDIFRFSFEYPAYYEAKTPQLLQGTEHGNNKQLIVDFIYPRGASQRNTARFLLDAIYFNLAESRRDPINAINRELELLGKFPGFRLVERSSAIVDGLPVEMAAYYIHVERDIHAVAGTGPLYLRRSAHFRRGDIMFNLWLDVLPETADAFWDDFDHVLDTFKFLD